MSEMTTFSDCQKDDLIVITGAGGFIAGALARYFQNAASRGSAAVDRKPLPDWYQVVPGVESLCLDVSQEDNCQRGCAVPWRSTTWPPTWAAWGSSSGSACSACEAS